MPSLLPASDLGVRKITEKTNGILISTQLLTLQAMDRLFSGADASGVHPFYAAIRDSQYLRSDKEKLEAMWNKYSSYADQHFLPEIKKKFIQRYWEMAVTVLLLDLGFSVESKDSGPDLVVNGKNGRPTLYIEAVAPTGGKGPDMVAEPDRGFFFVPHDGIILRYLSAVKEKQQRYQEWKARGLIDPSLPYVIALNSRDIPMAICDTTPSRLVQALYGIGTAYVQIDARTLETIAAGFTSKVTTQKRSGSDVSLSGFITNEFEEISAVLFACLPRARIPDDPRSEMTLAHNFQALNPLQMGWIDKVSELWYTGSRVEKILYA